MTSSINTEAGRTVVADNLAQLIARRLELLPSADDAHVLSELTTIERRIRAARTGAPAYDLLAA